MADPSVTVQALRAARSNLDGLVDSPEKVDAVIVEILQDDLAGDDVGIPLMDLLDAQPGLRSWVMDFIDFGLPPEIVIHHYRGWGGAESRYTPLAGNARPVHAARFVCPVDGLFVWFQPAIGAPIPTCKDHSDTLLVPG